MKVIKKDKKKRSESVAANKKKREVPSNEFDRKNAAQSVAVRNSSKNNTLEDEVSMEGERNTLPFGTKVKIKGSFK